MDDELFMADSSFSRPEESSIATPTLQSFSHFFTPRNPNSRLIAFHMMRSLAKRLAFRYSANLRTFKLRYFYYWRFRKTTVHEYPTVDMKVSVLAANLAFCMQMVLKKYLEKWTRKLRIRAVREQRENAVKKREEIHHAQISQMNRTLAQILSRKGEVEKAIAGMMSKEKEYQDTIAELIRIPEQEKGEVARNERLLKELQDENMSLKEKLEAVENNVNGFIKEMAGLLENEGSPSDASDGEGEIKIKYVNKKKVV
jgi:hypothetical protein